MADRDDTLTVRISKADKARLSSMADRQGKSMSELGGDFIVAGMAGGKSEQVLDELESLRDEVARLHRDLGNTAVMLLQHAGGYDRERAAKWARERLAVPARPPGKDPAEGD